MVLAAIYDKEIPDNLFRPAVENKELQGAT